jgi:hypothetical protein
MKHLSISFFLIFLLQSCSKPLSNEPILTNLIIGKFIWDVWKNNVTGATNTISSCRRQSYFEFTTDGKFTRRGWVDGSSCVLDMIDDGTYTYDQATSKITVKFNDGPNGPLNTEVWNNVAITNAGISYTWDENGDGKDDHYCEYKRN